MERHGYHGAVGDDGAGDSEPRRMGALWRDVTSLGASVPSAGQFRSLRHALQAPTPFPMRVGFASLYGIHTDIVLSATPPQVPADGDISIAEVKSRIALALPGIPPEKQLLEWNGKPLGRCVAPLGLQRYPSVR